MSVEDHLLSGWLCFVLKQTTCPESIWESALTLLQGFPSALPSLPHVVAHCIVGQRHDSYSVKMSHGVNSVQQGGEMPHHLDFWRKNSEVYSIVSEMKGGAGGSVELCCVKTVIQRYKTRLSILTSDALVPVARQHTSRLFVPVFSLQTNGSVFETASTIDPGVKAAKKSTVKKKNLTFPIFSEKRKSAF